jgi:hypothetical protein
MLGIVVVELQLTLSPQAAAAASVVGGPTGIYHSTAGAWVSLPPTLATQPQQLRPCTEAERSQHTKPHALELAAGNGSELLMCPSNSRRLLQRRSPPNCTSTLQLLARHASARRAGLPLLGIGNRCWHCRMTHKPKIVIRKPRSAATSINAPTPNYLEAKIPKPFPPY